MEAESGFNYSLTKGEMHKLYIYFKIVKSEEKKEDHVCFFNMIKELFVTIFENERLCYTAKKDLIENVFKTLENENKSNEELLYILPVLNIMSK